MEFNNALEKALNQGGYILIQLNSGDLYLYHSKTKLELSDLDKMLPHELAKFEIEFEFIFDRFAYESGNGNSTFTKRLKLKDIRAVQPLNKVWI